MKNLFMLVFFLFLLMGCSSGAKQTAKQEDNIKTQVKKNYIVEKYDINNDGKPDVFVYYEEVRNPKDPQKVVKVKVKQEFDFNFDGIIDKINYYDINGNLIKEQADMDLDGRMDAEILYENGKVKEQRFDKNFDGKIDIVKYFKNGVLYLIKEDKDFDGILDRWMFYKLVKVGNKKELKLYMIKEDKNSDGIPEALVWKMETKKHKNKSKEKK